MARKLFTWVGKRRRSEEERRVSELAATATPVPRAVDEAERVRREKKARLLAGILEASKRGGRL
ncbi:MAG TPA: hypothetical protein VLU43_01215 [Anaeromyxobacteraceae bacterium]|nr:hypothetical protein [Anaeromyxobacteraceae bacterium]